MENLSNGQLELIGTILVGSNKRNILKNGKPLFTTEQLQNEIYEKFVLPGLMGVEHFHELCVDTAEYIGVGKQLSTEFIHPVTGNAQSKDLEKALDSFDLSFFKNISKINGDGSDIDQYTAKARKLAEEREEIESKYLNIYNGVLTSSFNKIEDELKTENIIKKVWNVNN